MPIHEILKPSMYLACKLYYKYNILARLISTYIYSSIIFIITQKMAQLLSRHPIFLALIFLITYAYADPDTPIHCTSGNTNCTITNAYATFPDRTTCHAAEATYPSNEQQLVSVVASATQRKRKMKVTTRYSHSIPKLVCLDGYDGVLINTNLLNKTLSINVTASTMTVQTGVTLRQLITEAANVGIAIPYVPYWWGLTVGGMLGTGAHGSTLWSGGSSVHDHVIALRIVTPAGADEGYAKVRELKIGDPELDAAKVSLGVLGVISEVTFQLEPMFKRSITYVEDDDSDLGDKAISFGREHEFADIAWYPSEGKAVYRVDDRVPSSTSGNGLYDAIAFRAQTTYALNVLRLKEEAQEAIMDGTGKCLDATVTTSALEFLGYGLTNNGFIFTGYPVIGLNNRLQSSGACLDGDDEGFLWSTCPWDPRIKGLFIFQTTISITLSKVKNFIEDVQALVALDDNSLCVLGQYNGVLARYVTASSAYLGKDEDSLEFDFTYYRNKDAMSPRLYEDVLEEVEQMAIYKYGGLPHWGKNRNIAFDGVIKKYKNGEEFIKVKNLYDPEGLFSNEWTDQILGLNGGVSIVKDGCALEGLCVCSEDRHCAPDEDYYCRPGKIYKEARVCSRETSVNLVQEE
ncbi:hypothetical protein Leryth_017946 [Lithospermum erythrorhizon]|nr:hypothetical protein Leryth_017946 [Lithospermum erythrorhizon]